MDQKLGIIYLWQRDSYVDTSQSMCVGSRGSVGLISRYNDREWRRVPSDLLMCLGRRINIQLQ